MSAFFLYSQAFRSQVKEENPDITFGEVGKKLGEMWRALSEDEKQAYARSIGSKLNRGREAARAAAAMIDVFYELNRTMPVSSEPATRVR